jgi:lipopolysaccharide export system protein LptA
VNNPITGSYNAATGVLTITGTGTVAQYQEALRAVTFSTTAGAIVGVRTVSFVVTDVEGLSSISVPLAVTVLALNLPPVVTTSVVGPIVTAGSPAVTLDANVTIIDGSASLQGGTVSVGLGFSAGDNLGYTAPVNNPITGSYNAATGVLTLTGTGTVAQYQEALRAVTFSTTAGAIVGVRTVSFVVTDVEGLSSISVPLAVTVLALNLPPVVTTSVVGPIVTAGSPAVTLDANVTIIDGSASLQGGQVSVGLGFSAGDNLGYTAPVNNPITGSYNAATGVLTLTGTGTVAQYQEALRAVTFSTTAGTLVGVRTVGFVVTDVEGLSSISVPLAVTVLALNLPPVVTTSVVGPIVTAGSPAVTLDANVTIIDGSASLQGGTVSVGLGFSAGDNLGYTAPVNNPITGSYNAATGVLTLTGTGTVAQYQEALRAVTFSTTAGAIVGVRTVSFVVTDVEGLSSISVPLAVTVLALNLPPVVTTSVVGPIVTAGSPAVTLDANVTIIDGSASLQGGTVSVGLGFSAGDNLGYTAPVNNPITGSYNAATGVLTLTGTGTVAQYQEALRAVTFSTTAGAIVGVRTVSFVVTDVEGLSSISVPLAVTVLALNLPPVVTTSVVGPIVTAGSPAVTLDANVTIIDGSASLSGGTVSVGLGFSAGDNLGYTAPVSNPITGSYNAATGVLTLTGTGTVAQYQEALRAVTFSTTAGALVGVRTVGFVVTDVEGLSSISVPLAVTVLALNLPPVVTTSVIGPIVTAGSGQVTLDGNVTIIDGSATLTGATVAITIGHDSGDTLGYTAPLNNPITGSYNAATGVLTLTGTGTVAQYQEALRAVTFSTAASNLASVRTVSFVVTDDGGLSSISVPLAVTVLAINLPPVVVTTILNPIPFTAGNAPAALDPNVTIIDGSAALSGATVAITIGLTTGDSLAFTQPPGSSITGSYNSATGVLTLTGAGTVAQYQEALRSVTFATTTATLVGVRTIAFVVTDVGGLPSVSVPLAVTVALNLPPIVTSSVVGLSLNLLNGAPPQILDPGVLIVDDSSTLTGATVTVGGLNVGGTDTLAFTSPPGSGIIGVWNATTKTLTLTGTATVADYQTALRSVTFATSGFLNLGARVVSFVVKDQQGQSSISVPLTVVVVGIL